MKPALSVSNRPAHPRPQVQEGAVGASHECNRSKDELKACIKRPGLGSRRLTDKVGIARQRLGSIQLGIAPRACNDLK